MVSVLSLVNYCWVWQLICIISELLRLRQDNERFEASTDYLENLNDVKETQGNKIDVTNDFPIDLLRRHEITKWNLAKGALPLKYPRDKHCASQDP